MRTVALAGNPNVGKSTLFNALTGGRQHTGNWCGKTVGAAQGRMKGKDVTIVDLPGIYSLEGKSEDERLAAEFLASGQADCTVLVCDGGCLERNLILALQILQRAERVILCVNLMDEARRRGIWVDDEGLSRRLGIPVVLTTAGKQGMERLVQLIEMPREKEDRNWGDPVEEAGRLAAECVRRKEQNDDWRWILDRMLLSRRKGVPILLMMLFLIIWLTVWGANHPSAGMEWCFAIILDRLKEGTAGWPEWLSGILLDGVYGTTAQVIAVMAPPVTIFFTLFAILEDVGYLPRMAFLMDRPMRCCGGCGKQALTLCMGLGCNAVGVMGCRIIDSPRQRLAAIMTNAMVPCNGRFPALIVLGSLYFGSIGGALAVAGCVALGILGAMAATGALNGRAASRDGNGFVLELPPLRRPRLGQILRRSLLDRTGKMILRAFCVSAPAGAVLWCLERFELLGVIVGALEPAGRLLGMSGEILAGFLLSIPANELLLPAVVMAAGDTGAINGTQLLELGVTWQMAVCTMVFTVFHWPCATTLMTIRTETGSNAKTAGAFLLPTAVGCVLCCSLHLVLQNFGV